MRLMKYTEGWTRRHFLDQLGKGIFAAGVLSPLIDVIGRNGNCEAAYPPELLSIEAYTKGKLKSGDVLTAENVDIVKDLLDPGAYWQIKHDGRLVDLATTETDMTRMMPLPYLKATLAQSRASTRSFPTETSTRSTASRGSAGTRFCSLRAPAGGFDGQTP